MTLPGAGAPDPRVLATVSAMQEAFARALRSRLVNRVGADVPVRAGPVEAHTLGRALEDGATEGHPVYARAVAGSDSVLLAIEGPLVARVVGLLLGGQSEGDRGAPRTPTNTDLRVCRRVFDDAVGALHSVWPGADRKFELETVSAVARSAVTWPLPTAVFTTTVQLGDESLPGCLRLVIPAAAARSWSGSAPEPTAARIAGSWDRVMPVSVDAVIELGRIKLPLSSVRALRIGDLLPLGSPRDARVMVVGQPVLQGEPGERSGMRCLRIRSRI